MKKILLTLLLLLSLGFAASAQDIQNRNWSFKVAQTVKTGDNVVTELNNASTNSVGTWSFTASTSSAASDKTNGPRFGSKSDPVKSGATLALKNSDIPANAVITQVKFAVKGNAGASASKWFVKVGSESTVSKSASGTTSTTITWDNLTLSGNEISIVLDGDASAGFHLQTIDIAYQLASGLAVKATADGYTIARALMPPTR